MIRILVVSDTHGNSRALCRALDDQPNAQYILHLGDGASEMTSLAPTCTGTVYQVRGNCDFASSLPTEEEVRIAGVPILLTHGHRYSVKGGTGALEQAARSRGVRIALFGHTHQPMTHYDNGLYLVNPGSLGYGGTYATIDIDGNGIAPNIVQLR